MGFLTTLAVACALAFAINLCATPIITRIANHRKWFDLPNGRKVHTSPVPRLGGAGMFIALLVSVLVVPNLASLGGGAEPFTFNRDLLFVLAGFLVIFVTGLIDDFRNLAAPLKLVLQITAAVLVTLGGFTIDSLALPGLAAVRLGWLAWPVTVFWLVGLSNAMNLVDGVDGFAAAIAATAALALGASAVVQGRFGAALVAVCLLGAVAGFLVYNFPPARIFMGDSGSLLLGFAIAVLPLLSGSGSSNGGTLLLDVGATVTVLAIPVLDTATSIARRLRARLPIHHPDKLHVHHQLQALGLRDRTLFLIALLSGFVLGGTAFTAVRVGGWAGWGLLAAACALLCGLYVLMRSVAASRSAAAPGSQA